ncbi:uncharacterized protein ACRADG_010323 [Cochliomyia hominivorax]
MVDTKCSFINTGCKKTENNVTNSNVLDEDESLLRQPLRTSCSGFREAKKAYENGTDEVRFLLLEECSLIYECNVCRNMFRSLEIFFSHKNKYCKIKTAEIFHSFSDSNRSMTVQALERPGSWFSETVLDTKTTSCSLSNVTDGFKSVEVTSECSNKNVTTELKESISPHSELQLERVSTTPHAVHQTLKMINGPYSEKTELDKVNNCSTNKNIFIDADAKPLMLSDILSFASSECNRLDNNNCKIIDLLPEIPCELCKMPFQTEKSLRMHVQKKHESNTYVFQCPTCSITFLQPAAVIRHLANEHKKPLRRLHKMRNTILKRRVERSCRELKRLQLSNTKDFNNLEQKNGNSSISCRYCCKNFESKAALITHLTNCLARNISKKSRIEFPKKVEVSNEQIKRENLFYTNENDEIMNVTKYSGPDKVRYDHQEENNSTEISNINEMFANLGNQTFGKGLQTVSLEKLGVIAENDEYGSTERNINKQDKKIKKTTTTKKDKSKLTCRCKICNKQFNALSNLRRHISMFHYRSKRFGCNFCEYRAFRRYDIVNHLTFVHKMTGERESMAIKYVTVHEIKYTKDDVEGDIVVLNEDINASERNKPEEQTTVVSNDLKLTQQQTSLKRCEKREKYKNILLQSKKVHIQPLQIDADVVPKNVSHVKIIRKKIKKSVEQKVENLKRPIRNRIKTVKKDFVYDLLTVKEDPKKQPRLELKRQNTIISDHNNVINIELNPPPIKIKTYRFRTDPLIPANRNMVKGYSINIYRNAINEGLAAPSTLPDLPTKRPQMRSRLISSSRSDTNTVPIIETTELEAARLKSTFVDDSFLERLSRTSNSSFKMKPLLALQHSPLNSILQKFNVTHQQNNYNIQNIQFLNSSDKTLNSPTNFNIMSPLETLKQSIWQQNELTPNGKEKIKLFSPPATPKKRITLMERLAENRAKGRNSITRSTVEN